MTGVKTTAHSSHLFYFTHIACLILFSHQLNFLFTPFELGPETFQTSVLCLTVLQDQPFDQEGHMMKSLSLLHTHTKYRSLDFPNVSEFKGS